MKYLKADKLISARAHTHTHAHTRARARTHTHTRAHAHTHTRTHARKCTDKNKINPVSYVYIVPDGIRKIHSFMHKMNICGVGHILLCQPTSLQITGSILDKSGHWESNSRYSRTNIVLDCISPIPCKWDNYIFKMLTYNFTTTVSVHNTNSHSKRNQSPSIRVINKYIVYW